MLNGTKMFITNGTWADVVLLFARTGGPGHRGVSRLPGAHRHARPDPPRRSTASSACAARPPPSWSSTASASPAAALLGPEGKGFSIAMSALAKGRMSVAAGCVGIAQACLDAAVGYAGEREQFGKPIARYQLVQELITDISVDVDAARLLTWRVADLIDRGLPFATESSTAKLYASEAAVRAANNALQVFGGYGYIDEYPVGKLPARRAGDDPVRGHQPDPEAHHRPRPDRRERVRLSRVSRGRSQR